MSIAVKDVHGLPDANTNLTEFRDAAQAVKSFVDADGNYNGGLVAPPGGQGGPSDTVVTEKTFGQGENAGVAATQSRGDHTHGTMTDPVPAHAVLTVTHGATGAIVGTTNIQVLTNKDVRGNLILQVGTEAQKPAAGWAGRIYYATDTGILYYDTGPPDAGWLSIPGAKTDKSTLTNKGDIYVATAASAVTRLGMGINEKVLTSDNGQSTGLKWDYASKGLASNSSLLTISNSAAETVVLSAAIPAYAMVPGTTFRITASGIANVGNVNPLMTWRARLGTDDLTGTIACDVAIQPSVNNYVKTWMIDFLVTVLTEGALGSMIGNGFVWNNLTTSLPDHSKGTGESITKDLDTTVGRILSLTFQWASADADASLIRTNAVIERVAK